MKGLKWSWSEYYLYLVDVSDATSGVEPLDLKNFVQHASTDLLHVLLAKYDNNCTDYLRHAEELAHFAQAIQKRSVWRQGY